MQIRASITGRVQVVGTPFENTNTTIGLITDSGCDRAFGCCSMGACHFELKVNFADIQ